jgi:hypothetical protein
MPSGESAALARSTPRRSKSVMRLLPAGVLGEPEVARYCDNRDTPPGRLAHEHDGGRQAHSGSAVTRS